MKTLTIFWVLLVSLMAGQASAHKFHYSLAEVNVNTESRLLEVALKVTPEDLEHALQAQFGAVINLDVSENADAEIMRYLWKTFQVFDKNDEQLDLLWVGKQVNHKSAWIYIEIPYNQLTAVTIANTLLMDVGHGEQINTLVLAAGGERQRIVFNRDKYRHSISLL